MAEIQQIEVSCWHCRYEFSIVRRRHHCRNCAGAFCGECSSRHLALPHMGFGDKHVRVCDACYAELRFARYLGSLNSVSPVKRCLCNIRCTNVVFTRTSTRF
jgi:hypothetical protein